MALVIADWHDALEDFPESAIAQAARETIVAGRRCTIALAVEACTRLVADAKTELAGLRRLVDPAAQERARRRRAAAAEAERRDEEKRVYIAAKVAADPDWSPLRDALRRVIDAADQAKGGADQR